MALVVATEWDEFKLLDLDKLCESLAARHVVDARNILDREALLSRGVQLPGHRKELGPCESLSPAEQAFLVRTCATA